MTEVYTDPLVTLLHGDCLEVLPTLEADSVDAVVTDPPYGLEFMGKAWDSPLRNGWQAEPGTYHNDTNFLATGDRIRYKAGPAFQAWCEQWGREALRVTKPGGYLLAFGGTRTHHRLVCALEDAGWIIRDELTWIYASGFPKGKANLKPAHEPIVLARKPGPLRPLGIDECRIPGEAYTVNNYEKGKGWAPFEPDVAGKGVPFTSREQSGRWPSNVLLSDPELFDQPNPYVVGSGATSVSGWRDTDAGTDTNGASFATSPEARTGQHFGDSGGYSRFFIIPKADRAERERGLAGHPTGYHADMNKIQGDVRYENRCQECDASLPYGTKEHHGKPTVKRMEANTRRANVHPTVKPIDLMRHLVRLVTPPGGVVLDPFLGSGTTCLAASEEGFRSIGVERELEYLEIAKGRLMATPMGLGLDHGLTGKAPPKTHPDLSKHQPKRRAAGENYSGGWAGTDEEPAA
jgi:DNA modification methylase